jgi:glycosyltransferase involved in cell wall biosynthesis
MSKLKLLFDARGLNYPNLTGVNTYTLHLLYQLFLLKERQGNVTVTALGLSSQRFKELGAAFPFLRELFDEHLELRTYLRLPVWFSNKLANIGLYLWLYLQLPLRLGRAPQFDLVILPQPKALVFHPHSKVLLLFHDLFTVIDRQSLSSKQKLLENKTLYQRLASVAPVIWGNSYSTTRDIVQYLAVAESTVQWVYPAQPTWEFELPEMVQASQPLNLPECYILALSGIEKRKNWHNLIQGFAQARRNLQNEDLHLILAGSLVDNHYYRDLQKLIQKHGLGDSVSFVLSPTEQQKGELLKHCLFLAYPSFWEGFGFPILEAFAQGKAVLTSKVSSMPEIAQQGGLYVNPLDDQSIAAGISILVTDHQFRARLEGHARKRFREFSWQEVSTALEKVLHRL